MAGRGRLRGLRLGMSGCLADRDGTDASHLPGVAGGVVLTAMHHCCLGPGSLRGGTVTGPGTSMHLGLGGVRSPGALFRQQRERSKAHILKTWWRFPQAMPGHISFTLSVAVGSVQPDAIVRACRLLAVWTSGSALRYVMLAKPTAG